MYSIIDYDTGFIQGDAMHVRADYTPEYAAPEMILLQYRLDADDEQEELKRAFEQVRCQADTYAMACVFVYLLTGESLMCLDAGGDPVPPGQQMLNGYPVQVPYVHPVWRPYLRRMLSADPLARCSPREVIDGVNACITTGLFHELTSPFAGLRNYRLKKDKPPMCRANMAVGQRGNELVLLWHEEDCLQLRRTFFRQRRSVKALQKRQREALGRLEALALRLQNALGQAEILRPFAVLRQEGRVFCLQKLPKGELLPLSALHSLIQPEQIDQLMYRLLMEMQRCHQEGLICGTMDSNSLWVAHCEGHVQMILTGTHRMLDLKSLPHGSMIDASPELLAPELARYMTAMDEENSKAFGEMIGSQTDVFSLGLLYHLMLTGRLPEITDESSTCYGMAAEGESLRLDGSLSPERARIISRMIVFEPADRLQSCAEAARLITTFGELSEAEFLQGQNDEAPEHWENDLLNEEAESLTSQDDPPESDSAVDDTGWLKDLPLDFLDIGEAELWGDDPEAAVAEALHLSDDDDDVVYIPDDESDEDWFDEAGPEPEESPQALPDLETCFRVTSLNVRRDGFLKEPARRRETGESVLLRKLLPREAQWLERQDWYEARRRAWNDAAEEVGLLSVKEIVRHDGVLYSAFDAPEATEQPTWIDVAGNGVEQVTKCAIELVTQLERLRACNLCCSLISPGELLFTGEAPNVQAHLLGFDHVRRLGDMDDAREWAALLRDRWQQSDCGSWEVNQSQCYLAPEAWRSSRICRRASIRSRLRS
ncbi:MAG: hypothetical protein SPG80_08670 [Candidatus Ventricola sp.]|nr:hypothetical protein [Candidatus Ventricola sp.]